MQKKASSPKGGILFWFVTSIVLVSVFIVVRFVFFVRGPERTVDLTFLLRVFIETAIPTLGTIIVSLNLRPKQDQSSENQNDGKNTCKVANIFWSGHDLMWTINMAAKKCLVEDLRYGIRQFLYQLRSSGLGQNLSSLDLLKQLDNKLRYSETKQLNSTEYEEIVSILDRVKSEIAGHIDTLQEGYVPYPPENEEMWHKMKTTRKT